MKKNILWFLVIPFFVNIHPRSSQFSNKKEKDSMSSMQSMPIYKKILSNGLVVLVRSCHTVPQVSTQLWYHVGSKDEESGEKGLAHLIEHMIFKGTDILSETDITALTEKLSGHTNAFTSTDYTAYTFDLPSHHWKEALTLYADCMRNCRFNEQMLNSELKAVIQELKMNKDNYLKSLCQSMLAAIFTDHPYHYPVIGFKQDLWNLERDTLFAFYQKHYVPNNAVLVVVGDVDPEEVFAEAQKTLGALKADATYKRKEFYRGKDLVAQSVVLHRDVEQPYGLFAFVLPGAKEPKKMEIEVLSALLGEGNDSRLVKKLFHELKLVTSVSTFIYSLEDASVFMIYFSAKDEDSIETIRSLIVSEIEDIIKNGLSEDELSRAIKRVKTEILSSLESNYAQANMIGVSYLLTGDENLYFKMLDQDTTLLSKNIRALLKEHFSPATIHTGKLLALSEEDKEQWKKLQKLSDQEDARILNGRTRDIPVEPAHYTTTISIKKEKDFHFPKAEKYTLSNGMRIFVYDNTSIPKIELLLTLHARGYFDSVEKPGLYRFVCEMLNEGSKKYPGLKFMQECEKYAISLSVAPGAIQLSFLKEDLPKALELLNELLANVVFEESAIEKMRTALQAERKQFWDNPKGYAFQLVREQIYAGHAYSKRMLGTEESLNSITKEDLEQFYKTYISTYKARLALVGDLQGYDVKQLLEKELGSIKNSVIPEHVHPALQPVKAKLLTHSVNRDQVVLVLAGSSITRTNPDFEKLLLFDQMLCGSMDSYLFKLREETGLFYTIGASTVGSADEEPGMVYVFTIVSLDRLEEAKKSIKKALETVVNDITPAQLETAKKAILNGQIGNFSSNAGMANAFLHIDRFGLGDDYFDNRAHVVNAITLDQVKEAVKKVLVTDKMLTLQVGRL